MPEAKLHPLAELTLTRVREFLREKEAVFWVFIFPVLMTFALGIAFRNTAPDKTLIAIESGPKATEAASLVSRESRRSCAGVAKRESLDCCQTC